MAAVMTDCVSQTERSSGVSVGSVTTTSEQLSVIGYEHDQDTPQKRCAPGDCVLARRPVGRLLTAGRDGPYAWRLLRGVTTAAAYSAPRLRFSPGWRGSRCGGSDRGEGEGSSSVRSRAARMRDLEGPGSAIVVGADEERGRAVGVQRGSV